MAGRIGWPAGRATASERGTRNAVLNSRIDDFADYRLALDCGTPECGGERVDAVPDLARLYGAGTLMGRPWRGPKLNRGPAGRPARGVSRCNSP